MAAVEESLFERLCKVDPTISEALLKHSHRLGIEDYGRFEHVLKTEECSYYDLRKAIFRVFDSKLLEFGLDPGKAVKHCQCVALLPVCTSVPSC